MVQPDDEPFQSTDVAVVTGVLAALNVEPPSLIIFGQTEMWRDNVGAAYRDLCEALGFPPATDLNDGVYGAKIVDETVVYFEAE
jgi:hypothetical protein